MKPCNTHTNKMIALLFALFGAHAAVTAYDHQQLMETKHAEASHYSQTCERLDNHATAIRALHNHRQGQDWKPNDEGIFGEL